MSDSDREEVTVAVQTDTVPTFSFSYPKKEDETPNQARKRAVDLAKHDAAVALAETAHEYDWEETPVRRRENQIGTLVIDESAGFNEIEAMIDMGLESVPGIKLESNENGTYDIVNTTKNAADN